MVLIAIPTAVIVIRAAGMIVIVGEEVDVCRLQLAVKDRRQPYGGEQQGEN